MEIDLKKRDDENREQYLWRIRVYANNKQLSWEAMTPTINKELGLDEEEYLGESAYRKPVQYTEVMVNNDFDHSRSSNIKEFQEILREIEKAKIKLRDINNEYKMYMRSDARDEAIFEKIIEEIRKVKKNEIIPTIKHDDSNDLVGVLCISDMHYGTEFTIPGLFGDTINEYSPEIFEKRMLTLLSKVIKIVNKHKLTKIKIYSLGDELDGMLRVSQLWKLRYGVMESAVKYANFIVDWLKELSKHVCIEFQMTQGNHTELRMLNQPKGTFENDNVCVVISAFIKTMLEDNKNFKYIENPTGKIYDEIHGYKILGIHGEVKNMENALKDFCKIYKTDINYLIAGHLHHATSKVIAADCEVINVPGIIGIDDYSLSIMKTANAGSTFLIFNKDGKYIDYSLKLN